MKKLLQEVGIAQNKLPVQIVQVTEQDGFTTLISELATSLDCISPSVDNISDAYELMAGDGVVGVVCSYHLLEEAAAEVATNFLARCYRAPCILLANVASEARAYATIEEHPLAYMECVLTGQNQALRLRSAMARIVKEGQQRLRLYVRPSENNRGESERETPHPQVASLQQDLARNRDMLEGTLAGTWDWNLQSGAVEVNERFAQMIGSTSDKLYPFNIDGWKSMVHEDDVYKIYTALNKFLLGQRSDFEVTFRMYHMDGSVVWFNAKGWLVSRSADGRPLHLGGIIQDITWRRLAEKALRESENRFFIFMNNLPGIAFIKDDEGRYLFVNRGFCDFLGKDEQALIGATAGELMPREQAELHCMNDDDALERGEAVMSEELWQQNGTRRDYLFVRFPLDFEPDSIYGVAGVGIDISEMREAERQSELLHRQLRQAQKMESIGTLVGGIAHDFNNILSGLLTYVELTQMAMPTDAEASGYLEQVRKAGERAAALVKRILQFGRPDEQVRTSCRMHFVLEETISLLKETIPSTVTLITDIDTSCAPVMSNESQIQQIVMNLCTNAYQSIENRHGTLRVSLEEVVLSEQTLTVPHNLKPGRYARIVVADSGDGMDDVTLEKIFDPYFTTKEKGRGTGLGLSTVLAIIKEHHGGVRVESEPGRGTTFEVFMPIAVPEENATDVTAGIEGYAAWKDMDVPEGSGERILLVDDEAMIVSSLSAVLRRNGYHVTATSCSKEALRTFCSDPDGFDLMVSDQVMPGMTGTELISEINKIRPSLPVVLCTGYSEAVTERNVHDLGIAHLISKPVSPVMLLHLIRPLFDRKGCKGRHATAIRV